MGTNVFVGHIGAQSCLIERSPAFADNLRPGEFGLEAAISCVCTSKKLDRRSERLLS